MVAYRQRFDYKFVLMAGDNIYEGPATEDDYRLKFEEPYKPLLDAGVKFYAALGNHDDTNQVFYKPFNMDGHRYYTFVPPVDPITRWDTRVRFFALDSTYLDRRADCAGSSTKRPNHARNGRSRSCIIRSTPRAATAWRRAASAWRSNRRSSTAASTSCSPGTSTSTSAPSCSAASCISSPAAPARCAPAMRTQSPAIARSYDRDYHFMLAEITDEGFFFQAINRSA